MSNLLQDFRALIKSIDYFLFLVSKLICSTMVKFKLGASDAMQMAHYKLTIIIITSEF